MPNPEAALVVAELVVNDDLAGQTYTVALKDVVRAVDDPNQPGAHRQTIISLLNAEILGRHPEAAALGPEPLKITLEEFSDIKIQVLQNLINWIKETGTAAVM
jgi:hypothetical protein